MSSSIEDVYNSSLKFLSSLNLEQTYKTVVAEAIKLVGGTHGSILLAKRGILKRIYASNPELYKVVPRKRGYTYKAYKSRKIIVLTKRQIEDVHPEVSNIKMYSDIMIPLINGNKSIGVLTIYSFKKREFTKQDKEILRIFSPLASLAIRKAYLYNELNKAVETRDLFLSLASHELKTPVTTIYIYLQLIQRSLKKNKKFDPEWIKTLLSEMVKLTKIINELLELSRIRTGKLNYVFEETNIKNIIKRAIVNFKATHEHKILFKDDLLEKRKILIADFDKLVEVIISILDNAAKHSPAKVPIKLTLNSNNKHLVVQIEDQGKGIIKEDIDRVFEGFYKSSDNTIPGMGLGLYLSKQIVDKHKGKIKISSKIKKGTSVQILLPHSRK